jgi:hypothetical protein
MAGVIEQLWGIRQNGLHDRWIQSVLSRMAEIDAVPLKTPGANFFSHSVSVTHLGDIVTHSQR